MIVILIERFSTGIAIWGRLKWACDGPDYVREEGGLFRECTKDGTPIPDGKWFQEKEERSHDGNCDTIAGSPYVAFLEEI